MRPNLRRRKEWLNFQTLRLGGLHQVKGREKEKASRERNSVILQRP
jgi:hypothetical protein